MWCICRPWCRTRWRVPPLEQTLLVRDEMANLAWAIEKRVQGTSGDAINRDLEASRLAIRQQVSLGADDPLLVYRLATPVPAHWIPLLPVRSGVQLADPLVIRLQRAGMKRFYSVEQALLDADPAYAEFIDRLRSQPAFIEDRGTLNNVAMFVFHPRGRLIRVNDSGADCKRQPADRGRGSAARRGDREAQLPVRAHAPTAARSCGSGRSKTAGRGEASSGLRFDVAEARRGV